MDFADPWSPEAFDASVKGCERRTLSFFRTRKELEDVLRVLLSLPMVAGSLLVVGCGSDQGGGTVNTTPYEELVILVADKAARGKKDFSELFAKNATVPEADVKKYAQLGFAVVSATQNGDTAELKISVHDVDGNDKGTVTWTAVKEGDAWKLKDAPLP